MSVIAKLEHPLRRRIPWVDGEGLLAQRCVWRFIQVSGGWDRACGIHVVVERVHCVDHIERGSGRGGRGGRGTHGTDGVVGDVVLRFRSEC